MTRFPSLGVAGWRLALVILLGGCNNLTAPPPVSHDGGGDATTPDGAGSAETGPRSDVAGGSRADSESVLVVDAQFADVVGEARDTAGATPPGLDATGGFGGAAGTGDEAGGGGETGDVSPASPDAMISGDEGGAGQADGLLAVDLAAGDDLSEFVADGSGEGAGADSSVPVADAAGADTAVQPDVASAPLTVNAGDDQSICAGWLATLSAQAQGGVPPYSYAWSSNPVCSDCVSNGTTAQPVVTPPATTTFTVTAQDSLGAATADSVVITVVNGTADAGPEASVEPGAPIRIGTAARAGYTYAWTCDRPTCAMSSTKTAQPTVNPSLSTLYTLAATSPEGCVESDSTTVWVNLPVSTTPEDGEMAYPDSASLLVQFGVGVRTSSISTDTVLLRESASGTPVPFSYAYNPSLHVLTVMPTGANYNATLANYTLTLAGGASGIVSNDSLRPQRLPDDISIHFTLTATPDVAAPTIVSRGPAAFATGVATNVSVSATFSETLDPATATATNFAVSTGFVNVAGTLSYDATTSTITFVPAAPLTILTTYTVGATGIKDLSGNIVPNSTWTFVTGRTPDTTPPTVTAVSPTSGATLVSAATSVGVTFSEPVAPAVLVDAIQVAAGANPVAGNVAYDAGRQVATFTPSGLLASETLYTITVGGVKDLAGNAMTAVFTSTFTTANILFADSFESGTAKWTWPQASAWGLTTERYVSATHSLTDSPGADYATGLDTSATSISIDVTGLTSVTFSYWLSGQTQPQPGGDIFRADYSINGGASWPNLANHSGTLNWRRYSYNITLPPGTTALQVRFRFTTRNASQQFDGMYVDDVLVQAP